ncbi:Uncharacterised protein [Vibrio cholerae]|nr:Uncharacterised protein [Vibrio cholerae]
MQPLALTHASPLRVGKRQAHSKTLLGKSFARHCRNAAPIAIRHPFHPSRHGDQNQSDTIPTW